MKIFQHLRSHIFAYFIILAIFVVAGASYNRFIVERDYFVSYEGACDPSYESCFIGCEDEDCEVLYYYSQVKKYAPDVYRQCGSDITNCAEANRCIPGDKMCSVLYCDAETDGECYSFTPEVILEDIET